MTDEPERLGIVDVEKWWDNYFEMIGQDLERMGEGEIVEMLHAFGDYVRNRILRVLEARRGRMCEKWAGHPDQTASALNQLEHVIQEISNIEFK